MQEMTDDQEPTMQPNSSNNPFRDFGHGKKSRIYEYCQSEIKNKGENKQCLWVCQKRGRKMFAKDVSPQMDSERLVLHLQSSSWLNKYFFYGNIGIRQIEVQ